MLLDGFGVNIVESKHLLIPRYSRNKGMVNTCQYHRHGFGDGPCHNDLTIAYFLDGKVVTGMYDELEIIDNSS
jgi:hypothetical protein